mmetsp:Transcript_17843/g.27606  ORF Transcript_17843/g.27606 Transcript_17843/m.27606 type:complete len:82 (-) Transcript_17843:856-1101(-)
MSHHLQPPSGRGRNDYIRIDQESKYSVSTHSMQPSMNSATPSINMNLLQNRFGSQRNLQYPAPSGLHSNRRLGGGKNEHSN